MIDGASSFQMFRRLTLPMMGPGAAVAVCFLRQDRPVPVFDYVFVMTSGGPRTSTYTLSLYAWRQTFSFPGKWGYGATLSLVSLFLSDGAGQPVHQSHEKPVVR